MTKRPAPWHGNVTSPAVPPGYEDIRERAERLGITPDRVLEEYRNIGFADIRKVVSFTKEGMALNLEVEDALAIVEIVTSASSNKPYRVKFHDRTPVLGALARCLGLLPARLPAPNQPDVTDDDGEDPREILAHRVARIIAAGRAN
jgi:hypothetical protein